MPSPPAKLRTGKLDLKEQTFIRANTGNLTVEEIAKNLNRRPGVIKDFIENNIEDGIDAIKILEVLRQTHEYSLLKEELTNKELKIFEKKYSEWIAQFKGDILFSEQNQVFNAIKLEILMSNVMRKRKETEETMDMIDDEIEDVKSDPMLGEQEKKNRITNLRKDKSELYGIYSAIIRQHQSQGEQYSRMLKDLDASRSNRKPKDEVKKNSIMLLLEKMADDGPRTKLGEEAELERLSAEAEGEKYRQQIEFADGSLIQPFISGKE